MEEKKRLVGDCIICGKPAKYVSEKFISPLCEECAAKEAKKIGFSQGVPEEFIELDDYYTEPCEEMLFVEKEFAIEEEDKA